MLTLKEIFQTRNITQDFFKSNKYVNQGASYLSIDDVTMILNELFNGNWSFEVVRTWSETYLAYNQEKSDNKTEDTYFYAHGRLTVNTLNEDGSPLQIIKEDIGSNCVRKSDKNNRMDYSSGYKSAVSSALKGCAANLNIAVFKDDNFDNIKEFINKKKLKAYKAQDSKRFSNIVTKFAEVNNISPKEALNDRKFLNMLVLDIERESGEQ